MKLRDLKLMNAVNDGTRTLTESIMVPEVAQALGDFLKVAAQYDFVLMGGLALSFYVKPRYTTDADVLFLEPSAIPEELPGFKRHRPGAFEHRKTGVEVETTTPQSLRWAPGVAELIHNTAIVKNGVRIASPLGITISKLNRFSLQDQADIASLLQYDPSLTIDNANVPQLYKDRFNDLKQKVQGSN
jgi:hypothetical protein